MKIIELESKSKRNKLNKNELKELDFLKTKVREITERIENLKN